MLESPLLEALVSHRSPRPKVRALDEEEVKRLRSQGNLLRPGVELLAGEGFDPEGFHYNRFSGRVVLSGECFHSVVEDSELSEGCLVDHCPLLRRTHVGPRSVVAGHHAVLLLRR